MPTPRSIFVILIAALLSIAGKATAGSEKYVDARETLGYPELTDEKTHPEQLEPILSKINEGFLGMMKAYGRITAAIEDPVVREADRRYREAMAGLK